MLGLAFLIGVAVGMALMFPLQAQVTVKLPPRVESQR
jgi:hypothetical protein